MTQGRFNLVIYLGTGEKGLQTRQQIEDNARAHGYVNKNGKVKIAPYVVAAALQRKLKAKSE